jgi:hypothetical protein
MSPSPSKHPFDEWFERENPQGRSPLEREHFLAVWNATLRATMSAAISMRDAYVIAGAYEDAAMARDIAKMIGDMCVPPEPLPGTPPPRFPPREFGRGNAAI